ncbi:MAG: hypothetical protein KBB70_01725 [Candidatus Pacebacteria bacterium]|nr:hypothetical protein [Candidatus Paceibacterota bacterium]
MNFKSTTIGAISFLATGLMTVTMASGESIRLQENEGHIFNTFVYTDEIDLVCKYENLKPTDLRHPNRLEKIERNFSRTDYNSRVNKDFRRKQNIKARRNSAKVNNA